MVWARECRFRRWADDYLLIDRAAWGFKSDKDRYETVDDVLVDSIVSNAVHDRESGYALRRFWLGYSGPMATAFEGQDLERELVRLIRGPTSTLLLLKQKRVAFVLRAVQSRSDEVATSPPEEERLTWLEIKVVTASGKPVANKRVSIKEPGGRLREHLTSREGVIFIHGLAQGTADVAFPRTQGVKRA